MDVFILQSGPNAMVQFLPLALIIVVMYFFFIRPQAKKQRLQTKFVNELSKGKEVATSSGLIGKIVKIDDNEVTLMVDQRSQIRFLRSVISRELTEALNKEKAS